MATRTKRQLRSPIISEMLSGKLLRRGLQRALWRVPQPARSFAAAAEKVEDDIPVAPCRQEAKGRTFSMAIVKRSLLLSQ